MYKLPTFLMIIFLVGCASNSTVQNEGVIAMSEELSDEILIDHDYTQVCLKRNAHYYCGDSQAILFGSQEKEERKLPSTVMLQDWQLGSIFIDGKVVFVVVDESRGMAWTLPKEISRSETEKIVSKTEKTVKPKVAKRAGYHCDCPDFRKAFSAAATMATF